MFLKKGLLVIIALALLVFVDMQVAADSTNPSPDFDGNGIVDSSDFLLFVEAFGSRVGQAKIRFEWRWRDWDSGFSDLC